MNAKDYARWSAAVAALNGILGLGFGFMNPTVNDVFGEISGDFGIPTHEDIRDFRALVDALACQGSRETTAREAAVAVLDCYSPVGPRVPGSKS